LRGLLDAAEAAIAPQATPPDNSGKGGAA